MPQMNKGGKFIFGKSLVRPDGAIHLPSMAKDEYAIASEGRVYLFTGSKSTGGFCVTRKGLLLPSKLGHILEENPDLKEYFLPEGEFLWYKGRSYCWMGITADGFLHLRQEVLEFLRIGLGDELLSIPATSPSRWEPLVR